jgi:predicted esterase
MRGRFLTAIIAVLVQTGATATETTDANPGGGKSAPPVQPATGPGGSDYRHVSAKHTTFGRGATEYDLFEPVDPVPRAAPVIVFLHGWTAVDPWLYGGWIHHLTRRGNIVVFPRYQESVFTPAPEFTRNAIQSLKDALHEKPGHTRPDKTRFAIVGHSVGGLLTANLGALCAASGLPEPRALMSVQPGRSVRGRAGWGVPLEDLSRVPAKALLLCVAGERDQICGDADARRILAECTGIPDDRKNLVILTEDSHGFPALTGSHLAPCSVPADAIAAPEKGGSMKHPDILTVLAAARGDFGPMREFLKTPEGRHWRRQVVTGTQFAETFNPPNAQDFALWRLFDALCEAAFSGRITVDALAFSPRSLGMGTWSDGTPVKPMRSGARTDRR